MSTIRIVHTADNHIGMGFTGKDYSTETREALREERFEALERVVSLANERSAHFLIVAGDLFDRVDIAEKSIRKTAGILSAFEGRVVVLPGNHDYYVKGSKLWETFCEAMPHEGFIFLNEPKSETVEVERRSVCFYPGPCTSKRSAEHAIDWVAGEEKNPENLHIGVAHGSVPEVAPDLNGDYFCMTESELRGSGVDFWLLGHIHIQKPDSPQRKPLYMYSSTHTPDGFDCRHAGFVWYIEVDEEKKLLLESVQTGAFRFFELEKAISSVEDIYSLRTELKEVESLKSLVKLKLSGRISEAGRQELNTAIEDVRRQLGFLIQNDNDLHLELTPEDIGKHYSDNSLPHRLLSRLAASDEDNLALQLAHSLMEQMRNK